MKKAVAYYLIVLGMLEVILYLVRDSIPLTVRPHIGLLWFPIFVNSQAFSIGLVVAIAVMLMAAGFSLLASHKIMVLIYCIIGGVIALVDVYLPVVVLFRGGGHVLTSGDAGVMVLAVLIYDLIPVSLTFWQVRH